MLQGFQFPTFEINIIKFSLMVIYQIILTINWSTFTCTGILFPYESLKFNFSYAYFKKKISTSLKYNDYNYSYLLHALWMSAYSNTLSHILHKGGLWVQRLNLLPPPPPSCMPPVRAIQPQGYITSLYSPTFLLAEYKTHQSFFLSLKTNWTILTRPWTFGRT